MRTAPLPVADNKDKGRALRENKGRGALFKHAAFNSAYRGMEAMLP